MSRFRKLRCCASCFFVFFLIIQAELSFSGSEQFSNVSCSEISNNISFDSIDKDKLAEKAFECSYFNEHEAVLALLGNYGDIAEIQKESDVAVLYADSSFKVGNLSRAVVVYKSLYEKLDDHVPQVFDDQGARVYKVSVDDALAIEVRLGYARTLIGLNKFSEALVVLERSEAVQPSYEAKFMKLAVLSKNANNCDYLRDLVLSFNVISNEGLHATSSGIDKKHASIVLREAKARLGCDFEFGSEAAEKSDGTGPIVNHGSD